MAKVTNTNWRTQRRDLRTGRYLDEFGDPLGGPSPAPPSYPERAGDRKRNAAAASKREKLAQRQQLADRVNATVEAATRDNSVANGGSGGYAPNGGLEMGPDAMLHYSKWLDEWEADGGDRKKPGQAGVAAKIRAINATNPNLTARQRLVLGDNLPTTKISKKILAREAQEAESSKRAETASVPRYDQYRQIDFDNVEWARPEALPTWEKEGWEIIDRNDSLFRVGKDGDGKPPTSIIYDGPPAISTDEDTRELQQVANELGEPVENPLNGEMVFPEGLTTQQARGAGFIFVEDPMGVSVGRWMEPEDAAAFDESAQRGKPTYLVSARGQGVVEEHDSLSEAQRAADFYDGGSVTEVPGTVDPPKVAASGYHDMPVAGHRTFRGGAWTIDTGQLQDGRWAADFSSAAGSPGVGGYQRRYFDTEEEAVAAAEKFLGIDKVLDREESALEAMAIDNNQRVIDSANAAGLPSSVPQELDHFEDFRARLKNPPAIKPKVVKDWYRDFPGRNLDGTDHDGVELRISKQPDGGITQIRQDNEMDESYAPIIGVYNVSYNSVDERGVSQSVRIDDRTNKVTEPKTRWETGGWGMSKDQALAVEALAPEIAKMVAENEAESQSFGNRTRLRIKHNPDGTLTIAPYDRTEGTRQYWEATVGTSNSKSLDLQFYYAAFAEVEQSLQNAGMNTKDGSDWTIRRLEKAMAEAEKIPDRGKLADSEFAVLSERSYPIPDEAHGRLAIGRCKGKPEEDEVRAAVVKKFPQLEEYAGQVLDGGVPDNEYS